MAKIFISYRADDSRAWAMQLRSGLSSNFGAHAVFLDKEGMHAGKWREQLAGELDDCLVFVLVIGKRWLTAVDDRARLRLQLADDAHRIEVATALAKVGVTVIPVLVDGAELPAAEELPADLRGLREHMARRLHDSQAHWHVDLDVLVADIARATGLRAVASTPVGPPPAPAPAVSPSWIRLLISQLSLAAALATGIGMVAYINGFPLPEETFPFLGGLCLGLVLLVRSIWARRAATARPPPPHRESDRS